MPVRLRAADEQDGVVARERSGDLGQLGAVDPGGEQVRPARRGAQHDHAAGGLGRDQQLGEPPDEQRTGGGTEGSGAVRRRRGG